MLISSHQLNINNTPHKVPTSDHITLISSHQLNINNTPHKVPTSDHIMLISSDQSTSSMYPSV